MHKLWAFSIAPVKNFSRWHIYAIAFSLLCFFPYLNTGHHTQDDLRAAVSDWGDLKVWAEGQGRWIFYSLMGATSVAVFKLNSLVGVKILQLFGVISNVLAFSLLATRIFSGRKVFWPVFILLVLLLPDNWDHSQVAAGPLVGTIPLSLFVISLICFHDGLGSERNSGLIFISIVLYILSLQFSESFIVLSIAYYLIAWYSDRQSTFKSVFHATKWFFAATVAYVVAYLIFRYLHPSQYPGNIIRIADFSIPDFFHALWRFSSGAAPLVSFRSGYIQDFMAFQTRFQSEEASELLAFFLDNFTDLSAIWFVHAIFAVYAFHFLVRRFRTRPENLALWLPLLIVLILGSNLLVAMTRHYQEWVKLGVRRYLGSYYAYYGWVLLLLFLSARAYDSKLSEKFKKPLHVLVCTVIALSAFLNALANDSIKSSKIAVQSRSDLMENLMNDKEFGSVPAGAVVYAPDLLRAQVAFEYPPADYWTRYIKRRSGKLIHVTADWEVCATALSKNRDFPLYHISLRAEQGRGVRFLLFSRIGRRFGSLATIDGKRIPGIIGQKVSLFTLDEKFVRSVFYQSPVGFAKVAWPAGTNPLRLTNENIIIESVHPTRKDIAVFDLQQLQVRLVD